MDDDLAKLTTQIAVIQETQNHMATDVSDIKKALDGKYVTLDQFIPVRSIVYGLVGSILLTYLGLIAAVVTK